MRVMHDMVKTMEIPLERLRFAPDPLGIMTANDERQPCECGTCRQARYLAALSRESNAGETKPAAAAFAVVPPGVPPPAVVVPSAFPLITVSDVEGCRDRKKENGELDSRRPVEPFALPLWFRQLVRHCAIVLAIVHNLVVRRLVLGQPRLRVVRED